MVPLNFERAVSKCPAGAAEPFELKNASVEGGTAFGQSSDNGHCLSTPVATFPEYAYDSVIRERGLRGRWLRHRFAGGDPADARGVDDLVFHGQSLAKIPEVT